MQDTSHESSQRNCRLHPVQLCHAVPCPGPILTVQHNSVLRNSVCTLQISRRVSPQGPEGVRTREGVEFCAAESTPTLTPTRLKIGQIYLFFYLIKSISYQIYSNLFIGLTKIHRVFVPLGNRRGVRSDLLPALTSLTSLPHLFR